MSRLVPEARRRHLTAAAAAFLAAAALASTPSSALAVVLGALVGAGTTYWSGRAQRHHGLRTGALDTTLQVHQEAYTLWRKLFAMVHDPDQIHVVLRECETWWEANCLYLHPTARGALREAMSAAQVHRMILETARANRDPEPVKEKFGRITQVGPLLAAAVELPTIGKNEQPPGS